MSPSIANFGHFILDKFFGKEEVPAWRTEKTKSIFLSFSLSCESTSSISKKRPLVRMNFLSLVSSFCSLGPQYISRFPHQGY